MAYKEEDTCLPLFWVPQKFAFVLLPHTLDHYRVDRRQRPFLFFIYFIIIIFYRVDRRQLSASAIREACLRRSLFYFLFFCIIQKQINFQFFLKN
jgi:hypothetical protein